MIPPPNDPLATTAMEPVRVASPAAAPPVAPAPFVHRFGSIPLYLLARFAAFAIDIGVVALVVLTFGYNVESVGGLRLVGVTSGSFPAVAALAFGGALAFALLCEAIVGTTLGKALFALHVRRGDGGHAGLVRALARAGMRPIDLVVVGPLLAAFTPRHQRLGDFLAGTVVARSRIGPFATAIAVVLLCGLGYVQIAFGGGLTSLVGVFAETADAAPAIAASASRLFGVPALAPPTAGVPVAQPSALVTPVPLPSDEIH